jgi:hypothetical protein
MCNHEKAHTKRYVGSTDVYRFCPSCFSTFDGEESAVKKALINDACKANVTEADEVDGRMTVESEWS